VLVSRQASLVNSKQSGGVAGGVLRSHGDMGEKRGKLVPQLRIQCYGLEEMRWSTKRGEMLMQVRAESTGTFEEIRDKLA
jgi:hypothetical protein